MPTAPQKPAAPEKVSESKPTKQGYFFPGIGQTIYADSLEEATAQANKLANPKEN